MSAGVVAPSWLGEWDPRLAVRPPAALAAFNALGVLSAGDVHVARTLARLTGEPDDRVLLAAALAVRGPRLGHVCVDLDEVAGTIVVTDEDGEPLGEEALAWPEPAAWVAAVTASPLCGDDRPLRLDGSRLYLDRYWRYERRVQAALESRAAAPALAVDETLLRDGLARLFAGDGEPDLQRLAAAVAVLRPLAVVAGGPGTGKTTTVARMLALIEEQAAAGGVRPPRVALAAPSGKAAGRLGEAVRLAAPGLAIAPAIRERLAGLEGSTIHRLLGWGFSATRFRHDADDPLPHDVVVIDETSMVALSLMAKLLDAVRPDARVILLGDPDQLSSVEAGAVLGDIVGPVRAGLRMRAEARSALAAATGTEVAADDGPASGIGDGIVVLRRVHRFGEASQKAALAEAVQAGDGGATVAALDAGAEVTWIREEGDAALAPVRAAVVDWGGSLYEAARAGDATRALTVRDQLRVLCAHRRGPHGVTGWVPLVERWLTEDIDGFSAQARWYVGRPVLVTRNDQQLGLSNGDVGVVVARDDETIAVAFGDPSGRDRGGRGGGNERLIGPARLDAITTVHAMTIHKSQGSQFAHVVVVLPPPESRILTRELLYTAVTRSTDRLTVIGSEESVRAAVARPVARGSGLRRALWGEL